MRNRKMCVFLSVLLLSALCLSGCGSRKTDGKKKIVVTIFPEYDWVKNILGDNPAGIEITLLQGSGTDLHSYQPTAEDILKISMCDLFICVGGESDGWVDAALKQSDNKDRVSMKLIDVLGNAVKAEEHVEGMEEDHEEGETHEEDRESDEHVWLSLRNAKTLSGAIAAEIKKIDPEHTDVYEKNAKAYAERLDKLDAEYTAAVNAASQKTVLFGDRFPFRYLTDDYGLKYYAAFSGCSAETEASFETVAFLSGKVDELKLTAVLAIEGSNSKIAETIVRNTATKDQKILTLNSLQSTTWKDIENGADYIGIMTKNLEVLKEALR